MVRKPRWNLFFRATQLFAVISSAVPVYLIVFNQFAQFSVDGRPTGVLSNQLAIRFFNLRRGEVLRQVIRNLLHLGKMTDGMSRLSFLVHTLERHAQQFVKTAALRSRRIEKRIRLLIKITNPSGGNSDHQQNPFLHRLKFQVLVRLALLLACRLLFHLTTLPSLFEFLVLAFVLHIHLFLNRVGQFGCPVHHPLCRKPKGWIR